MPQTESFAYTGNRQSWTVPDGVTEVTFTINGASGGNASKSGDGDTGSPDPGGELIGDLTVSPGDTLYIYVGEAGHDHDFSGNFGAGGWPNGGGGARDINTSTLNDNEARSGGGGASSDIRLNGDTQSDIVALAGGGGGAGAATGNVADAVCAGAGSGGFGENSCSVGDGTSATGGGSGEFQAGNGSTSLPDAESLASGGGGGGLNGGEGGVLYDSSYDASGGAGGDGYYNSNVVTNVTERTATTTGNGAITLDYTVAGFKYASGGSFSYGKTKVWNGSSWEQQVVKYYDSTSGTFKRANDN